MKTKEGSKNIVALICLFAAPLLQLVGDTVWLTHNNNYSWNTWREASFVFFVPAGFLFARIIEKKSFRWALVACAFFIIGCFGTAAMMPLFRLGTFYPISSHEDFKEIVQSVPGQKLFAAGIFIPGLCFPVSLVLFGIGFIKYKLLKPVIGIAFIACAILLWVGNATGLGAVVIFGDVLILLTFCYTSYLHFAKPLRIRSAAMSLA